MGTVDAEIMVTFAENLELWVKLIYIYILFGGEGGGGVVLLFRCFVFLFLFFL